MLRPNSHLAARGVRLDGEQRDAIARSGLQLAKQRIPRHVHALDDRVRVADLFGKPSAADTPRLETWHHAARHAPRVGDALFEARGFLHDSVVLEQQRAGGDRADKQEQHAESIAARVRLQEVEMHAFHVRPPPVLPAPPRRKAHGAERPAGADVGAGSTASWDTKNTGPATAPAASRICSSTTGSSASGACAVRALRTSTQLLILE